MFKVFFNAVLVIVLALGTCGCRKEEEKKIVLDAPGSAVESSKQEERKVRIAVGGMITPKEGMGYYRDFLRFVQEKIAIMEETETRT